MNQTPAQGAAAVRVGYKAVGDKEAEKIAKMMFKSMVAKHGMQILKSKGMNKQRCE